MPTAKQKVNILSLRTVLKDRYFGPYLYFVFWKVCFLRWVFCWFWGGGVGLFLRFFVQNLDRMGDLSE